MAVVPQDWLQSLNDKLDAVQMLLQQKSEDEINSQWVESAEVKKMLGVSQKTWQTYRDERRIPFSQFGRKIYVKRADLNAFLEQHRISGGRSNE